MKTEKPMPWRVLFGSMLTMLSLFIAFLLNFTIFGQPYRMNTSRPPFGRIAMVLPATLVAVVLLVLGLALVFTGLKKMETKT